MLATQLSSKGQVVLPKPVREHQHWHTGQKFSIEMLEDGIFLRAQKTDFTPTSIDDVVGCLRYNGPALSVEQMNEAIADKLKAEHDRG